ncbi:uncharacterized protein LOC125241087 isoform X1 [Leguminivora glycinivorella]|uniref:uncharacterized protein LOC125241087 isoform X1 n=1 Tax=Leguminivora glycinivorella TaxID=1035111 RepID=UPI00200FBFA9|nr:uncharacterized protein LOC125241087 isoform X1 [Leguminivora glycinivorella]
MTTSAGITCLLACVAFVNAGILLEHAPECPEHYGVQAYAHPELCDQFFLCTNGTLTVETCENGLLFDGKGAVHNHCNYHWAVDCGHRKADLVPTLLRAASSSSASTPTARNAPPATSSAPLASPSRSPAPPAWCTTTARMGATGPICCSRSVTLKRSSASSARRKCPPTRNPPSSGPSPVSRCPATATA